MTKHAPKYVSPSIDETAFNCPHCGALAKQHWFEIRAKGKNKDAIPLRVTDKDGTPDFIEKAKIPGETERFERWLANMVGGTPFLQKRDTEYFGDWDVYNLDISRCYNCDQMAVWVASALVFPMRGDAPLPNADLPSDIRSDFDEAGCIFRISPRGAAALLRLAIQKLCKQLGSEGKNLDNDIKVLVKNGLDVRVQRSLDIVRVIGNEAVHPGQIDLRDDINTAGQLFILVNIIADLMITQPKHIEEMYLALPDSKRAAIELRDADNNLQK